MQVSREWLRRYWSGDCDGRVYDDPELYRLYAHRLRPWDSVVNYSRVGGVMREYLAIHWAGLLGLALAALLIVVAALS